MFTVMMSGYEVDLYTESHNPVVSLILLVLFVFIMCMVLLNCLIALMSGAPLALPLSCLPAFAAAAEPLMAGRLCRCGSQGERHGGLAVHVLASTDHW